jgi:hypothetical protein
LGRPAGDALSPDTDGASGCPRRTQLGRPVILSSIVFFFFSPPQHSSRVIARFRRRPSPITGKVLERACSHPRSRRRCYLSGYQKFTRGSGLCCSTAWRRRPPRRRRRHAGAVAPSRSAQVAGARPLRIWIKQEDLAGDRGERDGDGRSSSAELSGSVDGRSSSPELSPGGLARVLLRVLPVKKPVMPGKKTMMTCGVHGRQAAR